MLQKRGLRQLAAQLKRWSNIAHKRPVIVLNIKFPMSYSDEVPFVRIVRPRFAYRTGHVTIGGSICTEMLTPAGWRAMTVHALISSICEILRDGEAAVQMEPDVHCSMPLVDYSEQEARVAFERVAEHHGWKTSSSKGKAKRAF
jgi:ubiquitin-conjugating enzyme E2 Q